MYHTQKVRKVKIKGTNTIINSNLQKLYNPAIGRLIYIFIIFTAVGHNVCSNNNDIIKNSTIVSNEERKRYSTRWKVD